MVRSRCLEIETVLRKFNQWEQNLERSLRLASPAMTSLVSSRRVAEKDKERKPTSGLEPLTCSLRVCGQALLRVAGVCISRISKRISVLSFAHYCRALRL